MSTPSSSQPLSEEDIKYAAFLRRHFYAQGIPMNEIEARIALEIGRPISKSFVVSFLYVSDLEACIFQPLFRLLLRPREPGLQQRKRCLWLRLCFLLGFLQPGVQHRLDVHLHLLLINLRRVLPLLTRCPPPLPNLPERNVGNNSRPNLNATLT